MSMTLCILVLSFNNMHDSGCTVVSDFSGGDAIQSPAAAAAVAVAHAAPMKIHLL